jgi:hypothetical protein
MRKILILLFLMLLPSLLSAAVPDNKRSLAGLKSVGVIFDVNTGDPKKLLLRLQLIEETINSIAGDAVTPDVVVAFRGGATLFMTAGGKYLPAEDLPFREQIQKQARHLIALGYRLEQCAVAVRLLKVDPQDIISDVPLVGNGYISMIGYQNRGYAFVPMD